MTSDNRTNGYEPEQHSTQRIRADKQYDDSNGANDDALDEVFAQAHPNPGRKGCPSQTVLRELAVRQRAIEDPGYLHLSECSPCWVDFRAAQKAAAVAAAAHTAVVKKMAAAAAVFLLVGAGAWFFLGARGEKPGPDQATSSSQETPVTAVAVTLDLRQYAIQRGEQNQPVPGPVLLPRDRVRATILLPVGSEPGEYQLQVLDADRHTRASAIGRAVIRDYVTTLEANIDLRALTTGAYQFGVRHQDEDWRFFDAQLK